MIWNIKGTAESWLTYDIPNSAVQRKGYQTFRSIPAGRGKGCHLQARRIEKFSEGEFRM